MTVFVDTSAIVARLSVTDESHSAAREAFSRLAEREAQLLTTNYVLLESSVVLARRLGLVAARTLYERIVPLLSVLWVDPEVHREAVAAWLAAGRRRVSLVDWVSFTIMRKQRIQSAFAFDPDFAAQGFDLV